MYRFNIENFFGFTNNLYKLHKPARRNLSGYLIAGLKP